MISIGGHLEQELLAAAATPESRQVSLIHVDL
jgi:hypothetical protein